MELLLFPSCLWLRLSRIMRTFATGRLKCNFCPLDGLLTSKTSRCDMITNLTVGNHNRSAFVPVICLHSPAVASAN